MVSAPMTILSASFFLALSSVTFADDYQVRTDLKIEASAAARAAEHIGQIRGTISYDQIPGIIIREDIQDRSKNSLEKSDLSPRPSWIPPEKTEEALPPLVTRKYLENLDQTLTGSIKPATKKRHKFEWAVFDKYGNPVNLD